MSRGSRTKGARAENEVASELQRLLGDQTIRRNVEQYSAGGKDLQGDSIDGYHIEIKRRNNRSELRLGLWTQQAELAATADTDSPELAIIITRCDGTEWRCYPCMTLEQLAEYIQLKERAQIGDLAQ